MSHDNPAAVVPAPVETPEGMPDFSAMSDRELSEYTARTLWASLEVIKDIQGGVAPLVDKLKRNPLLGGLLR